MADKVHVKAYTRAYPKGHSNVKSKLSDGSAVIRILRAHGNEMSTTTLISNVSKKIGKSKTEVEQVINLMKGDGIIYSPSKGKIKTVD